MFVLHSSCRCHVLVCAPPSNGSRRKKRGWWEEMRKGRGVSRSIPVRTRQPHPYAMDVREQKKGSTKGNSAVGVGVAVVILPPRHPLSQARKARTPTAPAKPLLVTCAPSPRSS